MRPIVLVVHVCTALSLGTASISQSPGLQFGDTRATGRDQSSYSMTEQAVGSGGEQYKLPGGLAVGRAWVNLRSVPNVPPVPYGTV